MTWNKGRPRSKPYTEAGIRRVKCTRCEAPARFQWSACADGNRYHAICGPCDVALNRMVFEWMGHPDVDKLITEYAIAKGVTI